MGVKSSQETNIIKTVVANFLNRIPENVTQLFREQTEQRDIIHNIIHVCEYVDMSFTKEKGYFIVFQSKKNNQERDWKYEISESQLIGFLNNSLISKGTKDTIVRYLDDIHRANVRLLINIITDYDYKNIIERDGQYIAIFGNNDESYYIPQCGLTDIIKNQYLSNENIQNVARHVLQCINSIKKVEFAIINNNCYELITKETRHETHGIVQENFIIFYNSETKFYDEISETELVQTIKYNVSSNQRTLNITHKVLQDIKNHDFDRNYEEYRNILESRVPPSPSVDNTQRP